MSNVIFVRQQNDGNPPTYDSLFYKDNSAIARDYRPLPTNNFYKARDPKIRTTQAHNLRPHAIVIASDQLNEQIPFDSGPIVTGMGSFSLSNWFYIVFCFYHNHSFFCNFSYLRL